MGFFFLHIFAGEKKCNELQQEEFKATDALKKIVLDGWVSIMVTLDKYLPGMAQI